MNSQIVFFFFRQIDLKTTNKQTCGTFNIFKSNNKKEKVQVHINPQNFMLKEARDRKVCTILLQKF